MRIGVDGRVLHGPPTGTSVYTRGLVESLALRSTGEVVVATYVGDPRGPAPVGELRQSGLEVVELGRVRSRLPGVASRTRLAIPFDALLPGADWYLYPNFRWLPLRTGRSITVIYDLAAVDHGWSVPRNYRRRIEGFTRMALERSTIVVTPSHSVAHELRSRFPGHRARIMAVRPGLPGRTALGRADDGHAADPASHRQVRRGILFVGTVQPRKNVGTLLDAYLQLPDEVRSDHPLRIVGRRGWESPELYARLAVAGPDVTVSGYVTAAELRQAYSRARVVVAPSWYEGFDLPVLEAMAEGVPVVCSDIPVHHEVAGDAGVFFAPADAAELAGRLAIVLTEREVWEEAAAHGQERSQRFTWSAAADALVSALEACA